MSSAAAAPNQGTAAGAAAAGGSSSGGGGAHSQTFWCHECDMSVSIPSPTPTGSPSPLICPNCSGDFLEEMEGRGPPSPTPRHRPHHHHQTLPFSLTDSDEDSDDPSAPLRSPTALSAQAYLHRLIQHLAGDETLPPIPGRGPSPAHPSSIDAIPTVEITDPSLLCAVCKDEFPLASPARRLPCSHLYHSDCIVPWLSHHNSCPLCRSPLPHDDPNPAPVPALDDDVAARAARRLNRGSLLRHIARRHRLVFLQRPSQSASGAASPTQMAQAGTGPAASGQSVSSEWPAGGIGDAAGRLDDDGDTMMSDVRGWEDLFD